MYTSEGRFRIKCIFLSLKFAFVLTFVSIESQWGIKHLSLFNFYKPAVMLTLDTLTSKAAVTKQRF